MAERASELARRLSDHAEAVCRHYLSAGRRYGNYWQVGDVRNAPGRSMFVRLNDSRRGRAGKWRDAATGEHGDLLDIIRENSGFASFPDVLAEARDFLRLPREYLQTSLLHTGEPAHTNSPDAARRLLSISHSMRGTLAEVYLRQRAITMFAETSALNFHPRCYHRPDNSGPKEIWPAMIAAVTDLSGTITGAHRTWLARDGHDKAPLETPRKAMGDLLGNAVRFGSADDVMAAGEGIETVMSVRQALPALPSAAALSAGHLQAMLFPPTLRRLYIIIDCDPAGDAARKVLIDRAANAGIEALGLTPHGADFNAALMDHGIDGLRADILPQLNAYDADCFATPRK